MTCEINVKRLVLCLCACQSLLVIEVTFQAVRQMEDIVETWFFAESCCWFSLLLLGLTGRNSLHILLYKLDNLIGIFLIDTFEVEIEGLLWRKIARESLQRSTPHTRNHVNDKCKGNDTQYQTTDTD